MDLEGCGVGDIAVAVAQAPEAEALSLGAAPGEPVGNVAGRGSGVAALCRGLPGKAARSMLIEHR